MTNEQTIDAFFQTVHNKHTIALGLVGKYARIAGTLTGFIEVLALTGDNSTQQSIIAAMKAFIERHQG